MQKYQRCEKREIKYLTKEQWNKLRGSIDKSRDRMIIELLYETGCRVGEIAKIDIQDIDFSGGYIRIPWQNTKTKTGRTVFVQEEILNKLRSYLREKRDL